MKLFISGISGALLVFLAGLLGVGGGEFRIPLLIYLFGLDVKLAWITSLLVFIPTVAAGFIKHHKLNHFDTFFNIHNYDIKFIGRRSFLCKIWI